VLFDVLEIFMSMDKCSVAALVIARKNYGRVKLFLVVQQLLVDPGLITEEEKKILG
jgi:hypothetical protein